MFTSHDNQVEVGPNHILQNIVQNIDTDVLDSPITEREIRQSINKLKTNRTSGPDGLCIEMFKVVIDDIMHFLYLLFHDIYDRGIFPEDWCKSIISPIHKSGPVNSPENYRAIALINCLCNIFINILTIRLTNWTETHHIIDESQAGFRKGYGTMDNIFSLHALVQKYLCRKKGRFPKLII